MANPIQLARLNRLFDMYDANHDGTWQEDDFTDHVYKLAAMRKYPPGSPVTRRLLDVIRAWWRELQKSADTDGDQRVSREEFIAWGEKLTAQMQETLAAGGQWQLTPWMDALFAMIDTNGDGSISREEYRDWLMSAGVAHDTNVEAAFNGFTKADPEVLTRDEFMRASQEWWLQFDDTIPGARWIGPG